MNNPDTDWIKPGVEAVVTVARMNRACDYAWLVGAESDGDALPLSVFRPLPPPPDTAQRVVEAARNWLFAREALMKAALPRDRDIAASNLRDVEGELHLATDAHLATLRPADPLAVAMEALRTQGWSVAIHNDYRLSGEPHTFWLFTHPNGRWIKGEGRTDEDALAEARAAILLIERGGKGEG